MRLSPEEKKALKKALRDFKGEIYLFGSRLREDLRGGDIDLLLFPAKPVDPVKLRLEVKARFFLECEEDIDVVVYKDDDPFCREILKNARRINLEEL